jgi:hypothetical protein
MFIFGKVKGKRSDYVLDIKLIQYEISNSMSMPRKWLMDLSLIPRTFKLIGNYIYVVHLPGINIQ